MAFSSRPLRWSCFFHLLLLGFPLFLRLDSSLYNRWVQERLRGLKGELDHCPMMREKQAYTQLGLPGISGSLPVLTDTSSFEAAFCVYDGAWTGGSGRRSRPLNSSLF